MTRCQRDTVLRHIRMIFGVGVVSDLTDAQLLEQFASRRDDSAEVAFTTLVGRHGPMVLRVCRRVLHDPHDVEDAFQATFLVLVRKAGSIHKRASVGSWLHGVALRAAADIHSAAARRHRHEQKFAEAATQSAQEECPDDLGPLIHEELERLPERYRTAVVLCDLEGLTHEEVARRLGWPVGTVKSRQARGRDRLRARLLRLGLAPSAGVLGSMLAAEAPAAVAPALSTSTVHAALHLSMRTTAGAVAKGVLKAMALARLKGLAVPLVVLGTATIAAIGLSLPILSTLTAIAQQVQKTDVKKVPTPKQADPTILTLFGTTDYDPLTVTVVHTPFDDCRVDKVLVDLLSVKPGDPLLELFSATLAAAKSDYEMACSQWAHDKKIYDYTAPLAKENTLARKAFIDVENNEQQSRLKMRLAKDKLLVYGLTEAEIKNAPNEDGVEKARMTLRSRVEGVVVKKAVVRGNFYASRDELMTIVPLGHLWVRGTVREHDAEKLEVGQTLKVIFPFTGPDRAIVAKLDYIDNAIDPETRTTKFRTSIPNPQGRFKAGAFVRVQVRIPPKP